MILNAIIKKAKLNNFPNRRNQNKLLLLKKNSSDISISNKKRNSSVINTLSSSAIKKTSLELQSKLHLLFKPDDTLKTSRAMGYKFYIRNREAMKNSGKSSGLFSGVIKSPEKIVKKIMLDYKNLIDYDKEVIENNRNNYYRNVEYLENQKKVRQAQILRENNKFERLKNSDNRKLFISAYTHKSADSYPSSHFASPKYKSILKKPSLSHIKNREFKLEEKVNDILMQKKYLNNIRLKENAKKFCEKVKNLDLDCKNYEVMNDTNSKKNLEKNVLFNMGNLDRMLKLENVRAKGYLGEDYEGSSDFLKQCLNEYNLFCGKAISGFFPNFVKKDKFLNRTMIKYSNLQGKFFGIPV